MTTAELTVQELENSGYNQAAEHVLAGDQLAAARDVVSHPGPYPDAEDDRVRAKARAINNRQGDET